LEEIRMTATPALEVVSGFGLVSNTKVVMNGARRPFIWLSTVLSTNPRQMSRALSYDGTFDVGCQPQTHGRTITSLAKRVTTRRPPGSPKLLPSINGHRPDPYCGSTVYVRVFQPTFFTTADPFWML